MAIGIIGAMAEEVADLIPQLTNVKQTAHAGMNFYQGQLANRDVVVVQSGVGKVNAALCTQLLIDKFEVNAVINTGVAGGIALQAKIGDIIISTHAVQHDFDLSIFGRKPGLIPLPSKVNSDFPTDPTLHKLALEASISTVGAEHCHTGIVASGDQFIASKKQKQFIATTFNAICAEMEGAAIAHVAHVNKIPYVVIRAMSDQADDTATQDFNEFTSKIIPILHKIVTKIVASYSVCSL